MGNHPGTLASSYTLGQSRLIDTDIGRSIDFSGGYADVGTLGSFGSSVPAGFSIACWVQTSSSGVIGIIGYEQATGSVFSFYFGFAMGSGAGRMQVLVGDVSTGYAAGYNASNTGVTDGNPHFVVATGTPSANTYQLYMDGSTIATGVYNDGPIPTSMSNFAGSQRIGGRGGYGDLPFAGKIQDLFLMQRPLSGAEVSALYAAGNN